MSAVARRAKVEARNPRYTKAKRYALKEHYKCSNAEGIVTYNPRYTKAKRYALKEHYKCSNAEGIVTYKPRV